MKKRMITKFSLILIILLSGVSFAQAQHCDGCSVNIYGPETVSVGQTVTYRVTPTPVTGFYNPYWDYYGYLSSYATILDQGQYANGDYYLTLYFSNAGYTYLTFEGMYYGRADYDEFVLRIDP